MQPNDAVLVWSLGVLPLGARVLGEGDDGTVWIDMVTLGQHLPQRYRVSEVEPLDADRAAELGLCPACLGYGTLDSVTEVDPATFSNEIEHPCIVCGGSGRPAIRVEVTSSPGTTEGRMTVLPHQLVPGNETIPCLACSMAADEPFAKHTS